jgi:hypothetical protein
MALDPRISLGVRAPNASQSFNIFETALTNRKNREIAQAKEDRAAALAPFNLQQQQQNIDINQQTLNQNRDTQRLTNLHQTGQQLKPFLVSGDIQGATNFMLNNISRVQAGIEQGSGEDVTESMDVLARLQSGDTKGLLNDITAVEGLVSGMTAAQKDFKRATEGLSEEDKIKARRISLGLDPRAGTSAVERIVSDPEQVDKVLEYEGKKSGRVEGGKLTTQLKFKPQIAKAVNLAEKEAIERGDVLTDLGRMEASLPGVKEVVNELIDLSTIATSTLGGKAFDFVVKQSGFGSTEGADARAKMIAIVDNQVLPLLKETFGAAFTVAEGENLKASLVDPDASPTAKRAQLDAFLAQKERNIRTKQNQVNQTFNFDAQGNLIE